MNQRIFLYFIFYILFFSNIFSQTLIEATASVDKNKLKLGDNLIYTVTVKRQGAGNFAPEVVPPSFEGFRVTGSYSQNSVSIINMAATITTNMQYELIAVKSGEITIEPAYIKFRDPSTGKVETIKTKPIIVYVDSGKPKQSNTQVIPAPTPQIEEDIREIKMKLQFRISDLIPYLIALIIIIAALTLAAIFIFKKPSEPVIKEEDIDYKREALKKLRAAKEHLKKNNIKLYYSDVYEAVRYFLSMHLKISLNELTTREILKKLKDIKVDKQMLGVINLFMSDCDVVKFADYKPDDEEMEQIYKRAEDIINNFV